MLSRATIRLTIRAPFPCESASAEAALSDSASVQGLPPRFTQAERPLQGSKSFDWIGHVGTVFTPKFRTVAGLRKTAIRSTLGADSEFSSADLDWAATARRSARNPEVNVMSAESERARASSTHRVSSRSRVRPSGSLRHCRKLDSRVWLPVDRLSAPPEKDGREGAAGRPATQRMPLPAALSAARQSC